MIAGPSTLPGDHSRLESTADSEYRFTNAFWFATAPVMWSALPDIENRGERLRAVSGVVFLGGLARLQIMASPPVARIRYSSPRSGSNSSACRCWLGLAGDGGKPIENRTALVRRLDDVVEPVEQALMKERQPFHLAVRCAALGSGDG